MPEKLGQGAKLSLKIKVCTDFLDALQSRASKAEEEEAAARVDVVPRKGEVALQPPEQPPREPSAEEKLAASKENLEAVKSLLCKQKEILSEVTRDASYIRNIVLGLRIFLKDLVAHVYGKPAVSKQKKYEDLLNKKEKKYAELVGCINQLEDSVLYKGWVRRLEEISLGAMQELINEYESEFIDITRDQDLSIREVLELLDAHDMFTKCARYPGVKAQLERVKADLDGKSAPHTLASERARFALCSKVLTCLNETWERKIDTASVEELHELIRRQKEKLHEIMEEEYRFFSSVSEMKLKFEDFDASIDDKNNPLAKATSEWNRTQLETTSSEGLERVKKKISVCVKFLTRLERKASHVAVAGHKFPHLDSRDRGDPEGKESTTEEIQQQEEDEGIAEQKHGDVPTREEGAVVGTKQTAPENGGAPNTNLQGGAIEEGVESKHMFH